MTDTCPTCGSDDPKVRRPMDACDPSWCLGKALCPDDFHTPTPTRPDREAVLRACAMIRELIVCHAERCNGPECFEDVETIQAELTRLWAIEDAALAWNERGVESPLSLVELDARLRAALGKDTTDE